jgi:hypothetical protein
MSNQSAKDALREKIVQTRYGKYDTYAQLDTDEQQSIDAMLDLINTEAARLAGEVIHMELKDIYSKADTLKDAVVQAKANYIGQMEDRLNQLTKNGE